MAQTNKQINKGILLLTFLLLNGVVVSCDSCDSLATKEKKLMEKLKKQVSTDLWKEVEEDVKKSKNDSQHLAERLQECKTLIQNIEEMEKGNYNNLDNDLTNFFTAYIASINGTSVDPVKLEEAKKHIPESPHESMLQDPSIKEILEDKNNISKLKQYFSDSLELLENLKKQAELKK